MTVKKKPVELAIEALIIAGGQMSNLCFNLSRWGAGQYNARVMKESYQRWDASLVKYMEVRGGSPGKAVKRATH